MKKSWRKWIACSPAIKNEYRLRPAAKADLRSAIAYLFDNNPAAAAEFQRTIHRVADLLDRRPAIARFSSYQGFRACSLPKWSEVIIFKEMEGGIEIARLLDTRRIPPDHV